MNPIPHEWLFRDIPAVLFTIGAFWFVTVLFTGVVNTGSMVGLSVCAVLAFAFWRLDLTMRLISGLWRHLPGKLLLIGIAVIAAALIALACILSGLMIRAAGNAPKQENLPVIVLGCKVNGNVPSRMLRYRLETAADYLHAHPDAICVVSGGQGDNETRTEAGVMKEWLVSHGIEQSRILAEEQSKNTEQNLTYSKEMLQNAGYACNEAVIITDGYHQYRASLFAKDAGIESYAISAKTELHLLPTYWIREWFGLCKYFVFG